MRVTPKDAGKPYNDLYKKVIKMRNNFEDRHKDILASIQSLPGKEELLAKVLEFIPYPIQIYAPDGTSVMVNRAMLAEYNNVSPELVVGKYNIFNDPDVIFTDEFQKLKRAFNGETVFFQDIKVPLESIVKRYGIQDLDVKAVYQDITLFPITDEEKRVICVVAFFINRRVYRGKIEIEKAKEFIKNHWLEPFNLSNTAKAVFLSKVQFSKLFKKHTGVTPHEYYINYKLNKLKEKLVDSNLTIAQAFAACNMNYSSSSARLFKDRTGLSPSAYRKMFMQKSNEGRSIKGQPEDTHRILAEFPHSLSAEQDLFAKVIECFPYPIQVFSIDGTARFINKAALDMIGIRSVESHVDNYNCFRDPIVMELGHLDKLRQVLTGKTVHLKDFNAPYQDMIKHFNVVDRDIYTISSDITCFPLFSAEGEVEYFAAIFIFKKIYWGREEIGRGKHYIESHWLEPFSLSNTAKAACLSKAQFCKLFKKHTGLTPQEYYLNYKISKLKEMLLDTNLTIAQAFSACNMDYNGHSARIFRERTSLSPSDYRKLHSQKQ